jgi:hypothetical protein
MGVRLVRVDPYRGPHVIVRLGDGNDVVPFALAGRNVEEPGDACGAGSLEGLVLSLGEALVIEVAMAVDQPPVVASWASPSSAGSSRRGKIG